MKRMLEVFSGTGRMAAEFKRRKWATCTIDSTYSSDIQQDVRTVTRKQIIEKLGGPPDFIWLSPPCTAFSVASIGKHWGGGHRAYVPKSATAKLGIELMQASQRILDWFPDAHYVWENPMGVMRKMPLMQGKKLHTITFCKYGERRMKPTDLWTNIPEGKWMPRPRCKNGDPCHDRAPRGAKTGTQGIKGAHLRGALPHELCAEIAEVMSDGNV